jgi:septal ring factor EnvC (AmiA/AmiB activator)
MNIERIQERQAKLEEELLKGKEEITQLTQALEDTKVTVYRIQGAIQACKEFCQAVDSEKQDLPPPADATPIKRIEAPNV